MCKKIDALRPGSCPSEADVASEYHCRECWDEGCSVCQIHDPESGTIISVQEFDHEVYESEIDDLCMECHDPDCPGCNDV